MLSYLIKVLSSFKDKEKEGKKYHLYHGIFQFLAQDSTQNQGKRCKALCLRYTVNKVLKMPGQNGLMSPKQLKQESCVFRNSAGSAKRWVKYRGKLENSSAGSSDSSI